MPLENEPPGEWTREHAVQTLQECRRRRSMPKAIAQALWSFWIKEHGDTPDCTPFSLEEDNIALLLHLQAYSCSINLPQNALLEECQTRYTTPIVPPCLPWGPRAVLAPEVQSALNSPVMHAWKFESGGVPDKILVIGKGTPEIQSVVFTKALLTSISIQGHTEISDDILSVGVLSVSNPGASVSPADAGGNLGVGGGPADTAAQVLQDFWSDLKTIEENTQLVQTHEVKKGEGNPDLSIVFGRLAAKTKTGDAVVIWAPAEADETEQTDAVQYNLIRGGFLRLPFTGELLKTQSFTDLFRMYSVTRTQQQLLDAFMRWNQHADAELGLLNSKKEWDADEDKARCEGKPDLFYCWLKHPKQVWLALDFDPITGRTVPSRNPGWVNTEVYFRQRIPGLIQDHRAWRLKMERFIRGFGRILGVDLDSPLDPLLSQNPVGVPPDEQWKKIKHHIDIVRLQYTDALREKDGKGVGDAGRLRNTPWARAIVSRFIDCALRNIEPPDLNGTEEKRAFKEWSESIGPLLRFEWRDHIQNELQAGNPEGVFSRQTFFHTQLASNDKKYVTAFTVIPHVIVDRRRTAVVFDPTRPTMEIHDATSFAKPVTTPEAETVALEEWVNLLDQRGTSQPNNPKAICNDLRALLRKAPRTISSLIARDLIGSVDDDEGANSDRSEIWNHLDTAIQVTRIPWGVRCAIDAFELDALQTARQCLAMLEAQLKSLENTPQSRKQRAGVYLLRAIVEYNALDLGDIEKDLQKVFEEGYKLDESGGESLEAAVSGAQATDPNYVKELLGGPKNKEKIDLNTVIGKVRSDLSSFIEFPVEDGPFAALRSHQAAESAQLARALREVANELSDDGEPLVDALHILGFTLERILLPRFARTHLLADLPRLLTGHGEHPLDRKDPYIDPDGRGP